jgi:hypothetical protein
VSCHRPAGHKMGSGGLVPMPVSKNEMTNPHSENEGTTMSEDIRVACCLSDAELCKRVATFLARFESAVIATEELPDGYVFQVPGGKMWMGVVREAIVAERECCPFLTFQLTAQPNMEPVSVRVTGPAGTKDFLKAILCNSEESS